MATPSRAPTAAAVPAEWTHLELVNVSKTYRDSRGGEYSAAREVSISIARGDFYCLLGPSGCGKTTLLNLVAGFEPVSGGEIAFVGADGPSPFRRPVTAAGVDRSMIFQDAGEALFPWLNVEENILFGPNLRGSNARGYRANLGRYLQMVGLTEHAHKFPFELSGGMKQRVQIARALIMEPEVLLMDEPFAALDAITKRLLQQELARIWQQTRKTILYVTHDIIEALLLGTRVAVMTHGPAATLKREIAVNVAQPRSPTSPDFVELTELLEALLHEEVHHARAAGAAAR